LSRQHKQHCDVDDIVTSVLLPNLAPSEDDEITGLERVLEWMQEALREPLPRGQDLLILAVPASLEAPERALRIFPRDMGFLWRSPNGIQGAGGGSAFRIDADGADRATRLRRVVTAFFERVCLRADPLIETPPIPILFGGLPFVPDVVDMEPWQEFRTGTFSLPRWFYLRTRTEAHIRLAVTRDELARPGAIDELVESMRETLTAIETESPTSVIERHDIPRRAVHTISRGDWNKYIGEIKKAIATGDFAKIVAARRCVIDLPKPIEDTSFMARLFAAYPGCTHFAFRRGASTFMGATPETLFLKHGDQLKTHALAGTRRIEDDPSFDSSRDMETLKSSGKDLHEHRFVVENICDALRPFSRSVTCPSEPEARRVRHLVHLQTPISAQLKPGVNPFDLVGALHPTPAVGGFPTKEAAAWLHANEVLERGWYTGTIGWIDSALNAEFAVAIRCGVLTPQRAHVYAGAGIVMESDADAEYNETGAKLQPILRALGVMS
jgi:isochorismate synthase